jgi:hypothetical protein
MQLELHQTQLAAGDRERGPLSAICVLLETAARQPDIAAGLSFTVTLVNAGAVDVQLQKPDDSIQIEMLDAAGRPVEIPRPPPAALINDKSRPGPHPNAPEIVALKPGAQYLTVLVAKERRAAPGQARAVPLAPGAYRVRIKVLLLPADPGLAPEHAARVLQSDRFLVQFGE